MPSQYATRPSRAPAQSSLVDVAASEKTPKFGGSGPSSGIGYPARGTYAAFEACVTAAIPTYRAPSDVATVELRLHIYTVAQAVGTFGHR